MTSSDKARLEEHMDGTSTIAEPDLNSIDLVRLLNVVWFRRKIIFLIALFFALATLLLQLFLPNKYISMASFLPPSSQASSSAMMAQVSALSGGLLSGGLTKSQADMYIGILKSQSVGDAVIKERNLQTVYKTTTLSTQSTGCCYQLRS